MNKGLKVIISAEIDKLKKNIDEGKKEIKGFKDQVADAKKNVDADFKAAGESIKNGLKIGATGIAAAGAALLALGVSTKEFRAEQAKLITAFEAAGGSAQTATQTYNELYKVLGDEGQTVEAASHMAKLTTNEKELAEWTNICTGLYGEYGASLPIEGLTEAANETANVGTVTGSLADAINWAKVSNEEFGATLSNNKAAQKAYNDAIKEGATREDAFNAALAECATTAEREKLIRETLNGVYSNSAEIYKKNNADVMAQNDAQNRLNKTLAEVGETMSPVVTAFMNFANQALSAVSPYLKDFADNLMPKISEVLDGIVFGLEAAMGWISQHTGILATVAGIITGIVAAIGLYNAVAAVKAAMDAAQVTTLGALISAQLAHAAATIVALAPYLAIVAAIAAVIAIIVLCIKYWDEIVAWCKQAWEKMKEIVMKGVDAVVGFFKKIFDWIKDNWQGLLLLIVNPFAGAFKLAYDNCEGFRAKVDAFVAKLKEFIAAGFNWIKDKIVSPIKGAKDSAVQTFENLKEGIKNKLNSAKDAVKNIIDKIKGFFKFEWSLPKLKVPKFAISPAGWKVGDLLKGSIPKLSVAWYAKGGVFDTPTLFPYGNGAIGGLGENGAEAVVPLEKNTKWMNILADKLSSKMGGNTPIILQVDGKTFGQIAVKSINELTKLTGTLPLQLA